MSTSFTPGVLHVRFEFDKRRSYNEVDVPYSWIGARLYECLKCRRRYFQSFQQFLHEDRKVLQTGSQVLQTSTEKMCTSTEMLQARTSQM